MTWHNAKTNPPPVGADVLLAIAGNYDAAEGCRLDPVPDWTGMDRDASGSPGAYLYSTGHPVMDEVLAWTELPRCPKLISAPKPKPPLPAHGTLRLTLKLDPDPAARRPRRISTARIGLRATQAAGAMFFGCDPAAVTVTVESRGDEWGGKPSRPWVFVATPKTGGAA